MTNVNKAIGEDIYEYNIIYIIYITICYIH